MTTAMMRQILSDDYIELDLPLPERKDDSMAWKALCEHYFPERILTPDDNDYYSVFSQAYKQIFRDGLHSSWMLKNRSEAVRSDSKIVYHVVCFKGSELEWAVRKLQNTKIIAMAAVENNCNALQFTADLIDDKEVVHKALSSKRGYALRYASPRLQDDQETVELTADEYGMGVEFASERWKDNLNIALRSMRSSLFAEHFFSTRVKKDPIFIQAKKIEKYEDRYRFISNVLNGGVSVKSARNLREIQEETESAAPSKSVSLSH